MKKRKYTEKKNTGNMHYVGKPQLYTGANMSGARLMTHQDTKCTLSSLAPLMSLSAVKFESDPLKGTG